MTTNVPVTVGFICPFWLPLWGGAEQYHFRMAQALQEAGFDVKVFCATAERPDKFNGEINTTRFVPNGDILSTHWPKVLDARTHEEYNKLANHFAVMDEAINWCKRNGVQIAIVGNPFQEPNYIHVRELYGRLKALGIKVGLFNHDLSLIISKALKERYLRSKDWESAASDVINTINDRISRSIHVAEWASLIGSPLFYEPDFVISNSEWTARFVDPQKVAAHVIVHPLVDERHWTRDEHGARTLSSVDVLMVNPQLRKNPDLMREVILHGKAGRTHRVLQGGWGNSFRTFRPMIEDSPLSGRARVDFVEYVDDMREAYRSSGLVLFPSFEEGYGMTPVEAMYCGTPVVSSNYPAILEAVGEGAYCLCPYMDGYQAWLAAIDEVLTDRDIWRERAIERSAYLARRQEQELGDLMRFFRAIA